MSDLIQLRKSSRSADAPQPSPASGKGLRVLLISPSYARGVNTMYFPIGLSYLASYVRQFGHEVLALNMNHQGFTERYERLGEILETERIDVVGITGLTVAFNEIDRIIKFVRERSAAPVVLGGGITSCESELVMENLRPDFMVVGEGELIFRDLLEAIEGGREAHDIRGVWSWKDGSPIYSGEGESIGHLDELPFPDLELFGMQHHLDIQENRSISYHETRFEAGKGIPITASRSCPFRCTFCYHAGMGNYRRHSITNVVDHIETCLKTFPSATHISIYDELFSANKKRIYEFCDLLEQRGIRMSWFCQLRVDQIDQDLLHRMRQVGCRHISYGFESGSDTILESMDKKITADQIAKAVEMTRKAGIGIQANFLYGDPAETLDTLQETLDFQQEHGLHFVDWSAVIPYPGTRVYAFALKKGLISDRVEFIRSMCNISGYLWNNMVNMTELPDDVYFEGYVRLRELNDENHRKRPIRVTHAEILDARHSRLNLECPQCGREDEVDLPYPLDDGAVNLRTPIGMQGLNVVCHDCNRKSHVLPTQFPHVKAIFDGFQAQVDALARSSKQVVLLPAMDRYAWVFGQDINLSKLNIAAVLDNRPRRIGQTHHGRTVEALDAETIARHPEATFVILPWQEYDKAIENLVELGVERRAILSWNEFFGAALEAEAHEAARASA